MNKVLKWINISACSSLLIMTLYLNYKILINVLFDNGDILGLLLFSMVMIYSVSVIIVLVKLLNKLRQEVSQIFGLQYIFVFLLMLFAVYLDYFFFDNFKNNLYFLHLLENLIVFIVSIIFNLLTLITLILTMYIHLNKKSTIRT